MTGSAYVFCGSFFTQCSFVVVVQSVHVQVNGNCSFSRFNAVDLSTGREFGEHQQGVRRTARRSPRAFGERAECKCARFTVAGLYSLYTLGRRGFSADLPGQQCEAYRDVLTKTAVFPAKFPICAG